MIKAANDGKELTEVFTFCPTMETVPFKAVDTDAHDHLKNSVYNAELCFKRCK